MFLIQLLQTLKKEIINNSSSITLNDEILPNSEIGTLRQALLLADDQYLKINNVKAEDISEKDGNILQINAGETTLLS